LSEAVVHTIESAGTGEIGAVFQGVTSSQTSRMAWPKSGTYTLKAAAGTPDAINWVVWRTDDMPDLKKQHPLDVDIPEVEEDEWEKDPDVQAEMAMARGAYLRGETRSFEEYLAERRKRAQ